MNKELLSLIIKEPSEDEIRALCREKKEELGFDIEKALFPINPLSIEPKISIDEAVELVKKWDSVWDSAWAYISSIFFNIKKWKGVEHEKGVNPFQSAIDLWDAGYIASFDGEEWRLHCGKDAKIVWQGNI